MDRREFLKLATVSSLSLLCPGLPGWAFSNGRDDSSTKKLIVVLLRGGVDGLNVVAPYGDSQYYDLRPTIAVARPGAEFGLLDLDGHFGMNPALESLMPLWQNKSLAFVHASGSPDPSRSHFDAQDYMESGVPGRRAVSTGWLNRLVAELPKKESALQAISLGPVLPRMCSGPANIATVSRINKPTPNALDTATVAGVFKDLYNRNDPLGKSFAEGMAAHKEINADLSQIDEMPVDTEQVMANRGAPLPQNNAKYGQQLAKLFRNSPSIQAAFMDYGGWDTHVNEGNGKGQLANRLRPLAGDLADLVSGLGPLYKDTTIVVMSEFGRTAKENGNGGTDHGHGNVMWLLGGGVGGGKIYAKWPGLTQSGLHEARDLATTTDFRDVLASVLNEQMGVARTTLTKVFPNYQIAANPFVQA